MHNVISVILCKVEFNVIIHPTVIPIAFITLHISQHAPDNGNLTVQEVPWINQIGHWCILLTCIHLKEKILNFFILFCFLRRKKKQCLKRMPSWHPPPSHIKHPISFLINCHLCIHDYTQVLPLPFSNLNSRFVPQIDYRLEIDNDKVNNNKTGGILHNDNNNNNNNNMKKIEVHCLDCTLLHTIYHF